VNVRRRSGLVLAMAVVCGLALAAQPALAAPPGSGDAQPGFGSGAAHPGLGPVDAQPSRPAVPKKVWQSHPKLPGPKVVPGTGRKIAPLTSKLAPTGPKALPGLAKAKGNALKPGTAVKRVAPKDVRKVDAAEPEGPYYCQEYVSGAQGVGSNDDIGPYSDTSYTAELGCNFYLDYAYGVSYVVDRSNGYDGEVGYVGTQFEFAGDYYGASYGAFEVQGDLYDGGRQVEILFELYLQISGTWGACNPLPTLRYLLCDGVGTDLLHIVVGTGTLGTGLAAPVIRYAALGDSFSAGTGASSTIADGTACRRSTQTYSYRLAGGSLPLGQRGERLRIDQPNLKACHGAQIPDMFNTQVQSDGTPAAEGPQTRALNLKRTRLVTLTMGGNDVGFTPNLTNCILANCGGGPLISDSDLQRTEAALSSLYRSIRNGMRPDGRLVVLSYPAFLPNPRDPSADPQPSPTSCFAVNLRIDTEELNRIYEAALRVRDMIANAVEATGDPNVIFVDVLEAFRGQRLCSSTPMAKDITLTDIESSFHPNDRGYQRMSDQTTVAVGIGS
jgi:lysophospholipase L1-like esterase